MASFDLCLILRIVFSAGDKPPPYNAVGKRKLKRFSFGAKRKGAVTFGKNEKVRKINKKRLKYGKNRK